MFGTKKGVSPKDISNVDRDMQKYAEVVSKTVGKDCSKRAGVGAAGGMGFAFVSLLGGELVPGIKLLLDTIHLEEELEGTDFLLPDEGRLDFQTSMGIDAFSRLLEVFRL